MILKSKFSPSLISFFTTSLLCGSYAQADLSTTTETTVVTANRTAMSVDETLASVVVITREDIERSQVRSTQELLRQYANVTIKNTGGRGKQTSMFLRGTESNHTLFLIDGVKVGSATSGLTAFQNIPVDQIERVEVVKGPRSSLYGSDAAGGVVQIFTRKERKPGFTPFARVGAGSDDTKEMAVGFGARNDYASLNATYSYEETDGIDSYKSSDQDDDGFENSSLSVNSAMNFSSDTVLTFSYLQSHGQNESDNPFSIQSQESKDTIRSIGVGLNSQLTSKWSSDVQLGRSWDKSHGYMDYVRNSIYETRRDSLSWLNHLALFDHSILTLGYDYQEDHLVTSVNFVQNERYNHGVFTQLQTEIEGHDLEASLRYDDNEQFGSEHTGNLAWGYSFENAMRIRASYGTAFIAPSFNELFHPGFDSVFGSCCSGNPDLKPEQTDTFEMGVDGSIESVEWSVTWFRTRIEDLIVSESPTYVPENVSKARIQGLEFGVNTHFFEWAIRSELTLISAKSRSGDTSGNRLINRPKQTLSVMMDREFNRFSLGATVIAESESYVDQQNTVELPGYATLDIRAGYLLTDELKLQAKVENIFEQEYELIQGYNQPELTYLVSITYQP